jgi:DNA-binding NtrC family response regulator
MNSPSDLKIVVRTIVDTEKKLLIDVLEEYKWNKTKTAQQLEISLRTLYDKIRKYQIVKTSI